MTFTFSAPQPDTALGRLMALSEAKLNKDVAEADAAQAREIAGLDIRDPNKDPRIVPIRQKWNAAVNRAQERHQLRLRLYKREVLGRAPELTVDGRPVPLNPHRAPPEGAFTTDMDHPWRKREDDIRSSRQFLQRHAAEIANEPVAPTHAISKETFFASLRQDLLTELAIGFARSKGFVLEWAK